MLWCYDGAMIQARRSSGERKNLRGVDKWMPPDRRASADPKKPVAPGAAAAAAGSGVNDTSGS